MISNRRIMRFVFMGYVARSGSTMLAHRLAERCRSLLVLPEFQLPHLLFAKGESTIRSMRPAALTHMITGDAQKEKLLITPAAAETIGRAAAGAGIRGVLEAVVEHYARETGKDASVVLVKKGALLFFAQEIRRLFPETAMLHPFRDPRGAVNSLIHTQDPYGARFYMARGDALFAARYWKRIMIAGDAVKANETLPLLETRYEDLLADPDKVVRDAASFIGCTEGAVPASEPHLPVADPERQMHALVNSAPLLDRSEAWKYELRPWQGAVIERVAGDQMKKRGYEPWFSKRYGTVTARLLEAGGVAASIGNHVRHGARAMRFAIASLPRR